MSTIRTSLGVLYMQRRVTIGLLITGLMFALPAPAARADLNEEAYVFHKEVVDPAWDTVYEGALDVPRFDTLGGTRQLLGYRAEYGLYIDYTVIIHDNLLPYVAGSEATWTQSWRGIDGDGYVLFPATCDPPEVASTRGVGMVADPLAPGWTDEATGAGVWYEETITDPVRLDMFTGSGIIEVNSELTLSAIDYHAVPSFPGEDPVPWNPDLVEIIPQRVYLDMTLTYLYVPEPASMCLLAAVLLLRRR